VREPDLTAVDETVAEAFDQSQDVVVGRIEEELGGCRLR
jgi:hypothetical protein